MHGADVPVARNLTWHKGTVSRARRWEALGQRGATVWLTGLSGSGKSTIATALEERLVGAGRFAYVLDGDNLRHGLNRDLGFDEASRTENVRRAGEVARLLADAGAIVLVGLISPFQSDRELVRQMHADSGLPFVEVHVDTSLETCEERDPKGLYAKARRGEIAGFTGVDAPYEPPSSPDLRLTGEGTLPDSVDSLLTLLVESGIVDVEWPSGRGLVRAADPAADRRAATPACSDHRGLTGDRPEHGLVAVQRERAEAAEDPMLGTVEVGRSGRQQPELGAQLDEHVGLLAAVRGIERLDAVEPGLREAAHGRRHERGVLRGPRTDAPRPRRRRRRGSPRSRRAPRASCVRRTPARRGSGT